MFYFAKLSPEFIVPCENNGDKYSFTNVTVSLMLSLKNLMRPYFGIMSVKCLVCPC